MDRLAVIRREITALWAGGKGKTLIAIAAGWFLLLGTRVIYPVLLPSLSDEFDLTLTTAGLLVTIVWLGYALGQIPGGVLGDRYGERKVLTASVGVSVVGLILVVLAPTALILFSATGLFGLGISLYPIGRITALSDLYPEQIGRALGITMATGDLGQTLLPPIASVLTVVIAWQAGLSFVIPFLVLIGIIIWVTVPEHTSTERGVDDLSVESVRYVLGELRQPTLVFMGVILFLYIFIWQTFSAFYPTYLINNKGLSATVASVLFGLLFAVGVIIKPLAGVAYDRIGIRGSLPIVIGGSIIGLAILPVVEGFWPLVVVTVLISTILGSGAITQSYLADTIPKDIQGTGLGTVRSTASTMGAIGPVLFGAVADRGYFDEGFVLLAILVGVITLLTFRLPKE